MANAGPVSIWIWWSAEWLINVQFQNTNGSQFFITFDQTPWLDGNHTVFGQIVEGNEVLDALETFGSQSGRPSAKVEIVDSGELKE